MNSRTMFKSLDVLRWGFSRKKSDLTQMAYHVLGESNTSYGDSFYKTCIHQVCNNSTLITAWVTLHQIATKSNPVLMASCQVNMD